MTKKERSLLLYLETRLVDYNGLVDSRMMNGEDFDIARGWDEEGFVEFRRLTMAEIEFLDRKFRNAATKRTHVVRFSPEVWDIVHKERRARSERMVSKWEAENFRPEKLGT